MSLQPGDEVTVTIDGRRVRGHVLYVRGDSVRVELPGGSVTRPMSKVKPARIKALAPTVMQFANAAVSAGTMDADGYIEAMRTRSLPDNILVVGPPPRHDVPEFRPVPKSPKPWRSEAYRAFIRGMDCCARDGVFTSCDGPIEAHHHGPHAMSQKGDDTTCIPLCMLCHRYFHDHGAFREMTREDTDDIARVTQIECMGAWIRKSGCEPRAIIAKALAAHIREASK